MHIHIKTFTDITPINSILAENSELRHIYNSSGVIKTEISKIIPEKSMITQQTMLDIVNVIDTTDDLITITQLPNIDTINKASLVGNYINLDRIYTLKQVSQRITYRIPYQLYADNIGQDLVMGVIAEIYANYPSLLSKAIIGDKSQATDIFPGIAGILTPGNYDIATVKTGSTTEMPAKNIAEFAHRVRRANNNDYGHPIILASEAFKAHSSRELLQGVSEQKVEGSSIRRSQLTSFVDMPYLPTTYENGNIIAVGGNFSRRYVLLRDTTQDRLYVEPAGDLDKPDINFTLIFKASGLLIDPSTFPFFQVQA